MNLSMTDDGAKEIAKRSRGTPRVAKRLLRRVRDFAAVAKSKSIDKKISDNALSRLEVDHLGFDAMDRRYLSMISEHYNGGPVGVETLAAALSEGRDMLEEVIEPYLIQQGLLQRTPRGRILTGSGYKHLGINPPANLQTNILTNDENKNE
jgi:Holliday junction DNA helicase RuvB